MKNPKSILLLLSTALTLSACQKLAETGDKLDSDVDEIAKAIEEGETKSELNRPQKAYDEANVKMHKGMGIINADPDIAFMQGMVPHHQGAVDMAEIVLKYGKDPEARALAKTIIESQNKEITQMNAWLKARGVEPAGPTMVDHSAMDH